MHFRNRIAIWLIAALLPLSASFGIGLNEIMFDPDGNENTDEFIELYNETPYPVNLAGWLISDGEGSDTIIALEQGLLALPYQYVLILDMDYLPSGSTTYDGLVPDDALVVTVSGSTIGSGGLSNSTAETISLMKSGGDTASTYTYTLGNFGGRSDEKILYTNDNDSTNWANAVVLHGTPGGRNSVTPPERDLTVLALLATPSMPEQGENFAISTTTSNLGLLPMSDSLRLSERWPAANAESLVTISVWPIDHLAASDSIVFVQSNLVATNSPRFFRVELMGVDDRSENNSRDLAVSSTGLIGSVVINEIMYSPDAGMSEWVELVNASMSTVYLSNWTFGDGTAIADTTRRIVVPDMTLAPDSFLLLAADSNVFFETLPSAAQVVIWNSSNVTLNNNGDSLFLWNQSNTLIDRVNYRLSWGGETGKSLERVSPTSQSNDPLNWATSLEVTGGTPGRMNTRSLPESEWSEEILTLEPNPFSPDGDGRDDLLAVSYRLENADSRLYLKVYDVRGREVCRLANNAPAGFVGEMLWDGTDGRGRSLPTGIYIVYLEALGKGGSRIQTARRVVALARPS